MSSSDPSAVINIRADDTPFRQALQAMTGSLGRFGASAKQTLEGAGSAVGALRDRLVGLNALLGGGAVLLFARHVVNLADEMGKAAQRAGTTVEKFSAMDYAAKLAGVSTEDLAKAYGKLGTTLLDAQAGGEKASAMLKALGVDPSKMKDADELLLAMADRFGGMEDGARKTSLAIGMLGEELGPKLIPFLNQGRSGIAELRQEAERLGVVIGTDQARNAAALNESLTRVGAAATGASNIILRDLVPSVTKLLNTFVKAAKEGGTLQGVLVSLGFLVAKGLGIDDLSKMEGALRVAREEVLTYQAAIRGAQRQLDADPSNSRAAERLAKWQAALAAAQQRVKSLTGDVAKLNEAEGGAPAGGTTPARGSGTIGGGGNAAKEAKFELIGPVNNTSSMLAFYENWLSHEKRALFELEAGRQYSRDQEVEFWRSMLANQNLIASDRLTIEKRVSDLIVAARQAEQRQIEATNRAVAEGMDRKMLAEIEAAEESAKRRYEVGDITQQQLLALESRYEAMRYELQVGALRARAELMAQDPNMDPAARQRVLDAIYEVDVQHKARQDELQTRPLDKAATKPAGSGGKAGLGADLMAGMGNEATWANLFNGILAKTTTWRQGMTAIFASVGQAFVQNLVIQPMASWVAGLARMLLAKLGFAAQEKTIDIASSTQKMATKGTETGVIVTANAAQAGSGAASALASIPYVGPALAIAAMIAMVAAVSSLNKGGKSAAGGYDIPKGINPLTQLHQEEMVLPAPIANAVRRMVGDESEGGGGTGWGGGSPQLKVHPLPGGMYGASRNEFVRFFKELQRDRAFG